jgi:hypothetical protein
MATQNIGNKVGFSFFERESDFNAEMRQTLADNIVFLKDTQKIVTHGTEFSGGDYLKQADLTTYSTAVNGDIVQHVGATTNNFTHGYIYQFSGGTVTKEYTTLASLEAYDYEAGQILREGVNKTYTEVFNEYFPQGINTKVYRSDLTIPVYAGNHGRYLFADHKENGDLIIEDNAYYKIYKTEEYGGTIYYIGSNAEIGFDGQADLEPGAVPLQVSVYQVSEGKYITDKLVGAGGIILLDETLAPIAFVGGYTQYSYDEEYAEWETETITIPPTWTRIDVQPSGDVSNLESRVSSLEETTIKQGDAIESPSGTQSLSVTDDYIDAGHYSDTTVNNAALILGNGTSSEPHNAVTVDWDGNAVFDGDITDGDGNKLSDKAECISLTQSEYDNLTSEEQNNGTIYLIKDAEFHPENDIIISVYSSWSNTITQNSNTNVDYLPVNGLSIPSGYEVIRYDVEISVISGDNAFNLSVANTNSYNNHLCVVYTCFTPADRQYIYRIKATCLKIS